MAKKKEIKLKPKMTEEKAVVNLQDLKQIAENIKNSTHIETTDKKSDSDTFFRSILTQLFDTTQNVSAKTEYISLGENFTGAKLEYLSTLGNIPYLKEFINIFEIKRISYLRKGRQEIILALKEREQEVRQQQINQMAGMFGNATQ